MPFKHGRLGEILLNGLDVSGYFNSADFGAKVDMATTDTFKSTWHSFIPGEASAQLVASGYYDGAIGAIDSAVRTTLQVTTGGIVTFSPAGALTIGDHSRLILANSVDYKTGSKVGSTVTLDWAVDSTAPVGLGVSLLPLQIQAVGTNTQTGDGAILGVQTTTGAVAHAHVTAYTSGSQTVKFQDATTLGGAYTDIAGGAFPAITAAGGYRLVIPGTIRAFVKCVTIIAGAQITCAVSFART